ncbi:MAG: hypothetical protein AAF211_32195, partial [Myxococcota bacterium]
VLISQVLPHDLTVGYHRVRNAVVTCINGRRIGAMADIGLALDAPVNGFHSIEIDHHAGGTGDRESDAKGTRIVLPVDGAAAATAEVLERFDIPRDRSADLVP